MGKVLAYEITAVSVAPAIEKRVNKKKDKALTRERLKKVIAFLKSATWLKQPHKNMVQLRAQPALLYKYKDRGENPELRFEVALEPDQHNPYYHDEATELYRYEAFIIDAYTHEEGNKKKR
jgi:hypothetical protein